MIRTYFLPISVVDGVEVVAGIEYMHRAVLGVEGAERKLIQNTTPEEDFFLSTLSSMSREATDDEKAELENMLLEFPLPLPYRDLAAEIDELRADINKVKKEKD